MSDFWSDSSSTSILCVRTAKALVRLRGCAGSPEPSLVAYVISAITSWAGSFIILNSWLVCSKLWSSEKTLPIGWNLPDLCIIDRFLQKCGNLLSPAEISFWQTLVINRVILTKKFEKIKIIIMLQLILNSWLMYISARKRLGRRLQLIALRLLVFVYWYRFA